MSAEISHFAGKACALTLCEQDSWFYTKTHNCILQHLHPHEPTQKRRTRHTHLGRGSPSCSPSASTDESQIAQLHISRYIYILYYYEPTKKIKSGSVTLNDPTAVPVKWSIKSILQPLLVLRGPTGHPERMLLALPVAPGGRPRRSQAPCAPWLSTSPVAWHSSPHHRTIAEGKKEEVWQTWLKRCYCIV